MDERRFSDAEVREILKRAVEKSTSKELAKREGLSRADLKTIGEEVGIDADRLEDAARSVALEGGGRRNRILGGPTVLNFERKVAAGFDRADTPEVLSLIRRTMGQQSEAGEFHGSLEWKSSGETGERCIMISSRDGITTIHGSGNLSQAVAVTSMVAGVIGLVASIIAFDVIVDSGSVVGLIALPVLLATFFWVLRGILRKFTRSESVKLQTTVDQLARLTGESGD